MAEPADAQDLGSCPARGPGSTPGVRILLIHSNLFGLLLYAPIMVAHDVTTSVTKALVRRPRALFGSLTPRWVGLALDIRLTPVP